MAGGSLQGILRRCARRMASGLLSGLLVASAWVDASSAMDDAAAAAAFVGEAEDCPTQPNERSIVVGSGGANHDVALVTDQSGDEALEPIANVSEYEPELAEASSSRLREALVPTLADAPENDKPGYAPAAKGTPKRPTADDVCVDEEIAFEPAARPETASFNGVTPGVTTRADILEQWGEPFQGEEGDDGLVYKLELFPTIKVALAGDRVESIRVELLQPAEPKGLIGKLGLSEFRPLATNDIDGNLVCTTYPERGVTLSYGPGAGAAVASDDADSGEAPAGGVREIEVRPVDAESFLARADLETAMRLGAKEARIIHMLSQAKLATNQAAVAEKLAAQAVQLEPRNDEYRVHWAHCLKRLARYSEAVEQTRKVLEGTTATQIVRAQALEQMGSLAALGSRDVQQRAIPLCNKAIELADALAQSDDEATRADAHRVLLDAHLAIAERIAAGEWQRKDEFVGQWMTRASALAEEMIAAGEADVSLRLRVAVSGLVAGGRLSPPIDPELWIAEAEQACSDVEPALKDTLARHLLHWQLGMAYFYAAEIQHRRGEADSAIKYGELADATLTPIADKRARVPDTNYVLGRLYFQIGAVHAVHRRDHEEACQWYDRAAELLLAPVPLTPLAHPGQHGDALVSMGVSYWEVGQQDRAYELTSAGVDLVKQGVGEGLLATTALDVPQGNLNAMGRALGKAELNTPDLSSGGRTQLAQKQRNANKRSGNARPQAQTARRTTGDGVRRR